MVRRWRSLGDAFIRFRLVYTIMIQRFIDKVDKTGNCWEWIARKNVKGYGTFKLNNNTMLAHRVSYEYFKGLIPKGLTIDHLCRNRHCVNPDHLEAVSHIDNVRRGNTGLYMKSKTHCPQGHEYINDNLYVNVKGSRTCRMCTRKSTMDSYYKRKNIMRQLGFDI